MYKTNTCICDLCSICLPALLFLGLQEDFEAWLESSLHNLKRAIEGRKVTAKGCKSTCKKQCSSKTKKEGEEKDEAGGKCSSDEDSNHEDEVV